MKELELIIKNFEDDCSSLAISHDSPNEEMIKEEFEKYYQAKLKLLSIANVNVSLPSKDEVVSEGFRIDKHGGYNYRRVLKDQDHDIYYSGWLDCYDWISKGNER